MSLERIKTALNRDPANKAFYASGLSQKTEITVLTPDGTPLEVSVEIPIYMSTVDTLLKLIQEKAGLNP